jgi:phage terminase large subunit-like protein
VHGVLDYPETGPSIRHITAKGSKSLRAQMAAPLYEQRRVHHIGHLAKLEHQQATWQPTQDSPDRMDVAVHAVLVGSGATVATLSAPSGNVPTRSTRRHRSMVLPRSTRR